MFPISIKHKARSNLKIKSLLSLGVVIEGFDEPNWKIFEESKKQFGLFFCYFIMVMNVFNFRKIL